MNDLTFMLIVFFSYSALFTFLIFCVKKDIEEETQNLRFHHACRMDNIERKIHELARELGYEYDTKWFKKGKKK